jgi:hypothetical protein
MTQTICFEHWNFGDWNLFVIWCLGFGIWNLGFGIWNLGFGIWNLVLGIWNLGFGIWDLGFGICTGEQKVGRSIEIESFLF